MISICLEQLNDGSAVLAQWACIALGRLWRGFEAARWAGARDLAHEKLFGLMQHEQPEVRARVGAEGRTCSRVRKKAALRPPRHAIKTLRQTCCNGEPLASIWGHTCKR